LVMQNWHARDEFDRGAAHASPSGQIPQAPGDQTQAAAARP
jgi:hypothetical protein